MNPKCSKCGSEDNLSQCPKCKKLFCRGCSTFIPTSDRNYPNIYEAISFCPECDKLHPKNSS